MTAAIMQLLQDPHQIGAASMRHQIHRRCDNRSPQSRLDATAPLLLASVRSIVYTLLASRTELASGADHQVIPMLQFELGEAVQVHADNAAVRSPASHFGNAKLGMGDLSAFALQRGSSLPWERMLKIRR